MEAKRTIMVAKKERAYKLDKALKTAMTLISQKDEKLESAWTALAKAEAKALVNVVVVRVEARKADEAEVAAICAEAKQVAKNAVAAF